MGGGVSVMEGGGVRVMWGELNKNISNEYVLRNVTCWSARQFHNPSRVWVPPSLCSCQRCQSPRATDTTLRRGEIRALWIAHARTECWPARTWSCFWSGSTARFWSVCSSLTIMSYSRARFHKTHESMPFLELWMRRHRLRNVQRLCLPTVSFFSGCFDGAKADGQSPKDDSPRQETFLHRYGYEVLSYRNSRITKD